MIVVAADAGGFGEVDLALLERAATAVLRESAITRARLSIALLDDTTIQAMNRDYLRRDYVTDVIAFALHEEGDPVVGDVYVGLEQARRQSEEHGIELGEELVRLTVHGVLHVLGHDHPDVDRESSEFFVLQENLVGAIIGSGGSRG